MDTHEIADTTNNTEDDSKDDNDCMNLENQSLVVVQYHTNNNNHNRTNNYTNNKDNNDTNNNNNDNNNNNKNNVEPHRRQTIVSSSLSSSSFIIRNNNRLIVLILLLVSLSIIVVLYYYIMILNYYGTLFIGTTTTTTTYISLNTDGQYEKLIVQYDDISEIPDQEVITIQLIQQLSLIEGTYNKNNKNSSSSSSSNISSILRVILLSKRTVCLSGQCIYRVYLSGPTLYGYYLQVDYNRNKRNIYTIDIPIYYESYNDDYNNYTAFIVLETIRNVSKELGPVPYYTVDFTSETNFSYGIRISKPNNSIPIPNRILLSSSSSSSSTPIAPSIHTANTSQLEQQQQQQQQQRLPECQYRSSDVGINHFEWVERSILELYGYTPYDTLMIPEYLLDPQRDIYHFEQLPNLQTTDKTYSTSSVYG